MTGQVACRWKTLSLKTARSWYARIGAKEKPHRIGASWGLADSANSLAPLACRRKNPVRRGEASLHGRRAARGASE